MPPEARKAADKELERLRMIPPESAEHTVVRTYIDWLVSLPWSVSTEDNLDIANARKVLDEDHYDLDKIKERILEFLAVRKLKKDTKGPILCFVGPPGTGKTSLGKSIARALGRKFVRLSLGGIRDEAEIRGHRRTYIGSLPGRIIQGCATPARTIRSSSWTRSTSSGWISGAIPPRRCSKCSIPSRTTPSPTIISTCRSISRRCLFITTANMLDPIPPALRDRMEVLELPGYTEEEKLQIAERHLIRKQLEENGLGESKIEFTAGAIAEIIRSYTREAGLRNLEREIARVCRKIARATSEGGAMPTQVTRGRVSRYLGLPRFFSEVAERTNETGVATGLAWTPNGGDILFIEATRMAGQKGLMLTGSLGDVMKESAQAAMSYVRSRAERLGYPGRLFRKVGHPRSRSGGRDSQGRTLGRCDARGFAGVAAERPPDQGGSRDDRRDHAARQGPAGRRNQGKSARGTPRRNQDDHSAAAQRARPRGHSRRGPWRAEDHLRRHRR